MSSISCSIARYSWSVAYKHLASAPTRILDAVTDWHNSPYQLLPAAEHNDGAAAIAAVRQAELAEQLPHYLQVLPVVCPRQHQDLQHAFLLTFDSPHRGSVRSMDGTSCIVLVLHMASCS